MSLLKHEIAQHDGKIEENITQQIFSEAKINMTIVQKKQQYCASEDTCMVKGLEWRTNALVIALTREPHEIRMIRQQTRCFFYDAAGEVEVNSDVPFYCRN